MAGIKTLDDLDVRGKRVIVRADLNVPMTHGKVTDSTRIDRLAPTFADLAKRGAKVIVISHFGRPKGRRLPAFSLEPLAEPLRNALGGRWVVFAHDCVGPEAQAAVAGLKEGEVALLENLRFEPGEEKNDAEFARRLAALGDIYVDDALSCAHRAHASIVALAHLLPAAAGRLMTAELAALDELENPKRPVAALVGGSKVSSKLELLGNLLRHVDLLFIGGAMANTFFAAEGHEIGKSVYEPDLLGEARDILQRAAARPEMTLMLASDVVIARALQPGVATRVVPVDAVPPDEMICDIGPRTAEALDKRLESCRTLVWNGPLGAFEVPPFDAGTSSVARAAAALTKAGRMRSVAGGGDTVAALGHAGVAQDFSYILTAGGAFLEWLAGKELPGITALKTAPGAPQSAVAGAKKPAASHP
jgi:phosphoglycerate kinase